jgi:hypothetical protein
MRTPDVHNAHRAGVRCQLMKARAVYFGENERLRLFRHAEFTLEGQLVGR